MFSLRQTGCRDCVTAAFTGCAAVNGQPANRCRALEKNMSLSNRPDCWVAAVGMLRIFTDDGDDIPVTVLDVSNNRVAQVKTEETDGYVSLCR